MTDNRTTELLKDYAFALRRLEYDADKTGTNMTLGEYEAEEKRVTYEYAQAIAATLGSEREKKLEKLVEQLWYLVNHRSGYGYAAALESIEELGIEVVDNAD